MSRSLQLKLFISALLMAVALLAGQDDRQWTIGFLAFGILNVFASSPGTGIVRAAAVIAAFLGLFARSSAVLAIIMVFVWLLWPPAFLSAWAVARQQRDESSGLDGEAVWRKSPARIGATALIVAVAAASIAYRLLVIGGVQQTAALFVGLPALIAIVVVFGVSPNSAIGVAFKAVTVGLLVSLVLLQEGFLCVAMAAPLFYAVAMGVAATMSAAKRLPEDKFVRRWMSGAVIVVTVPMSLEGVTPATSLNRYEHVVVSRVVPAPADEIERAILRQPRFDRTRPRYLRAGFPTVASTRVETDGRETRWVIQVRGGEMLINGMEHKTGELILSLAERQPGRVRWHVVSDTSHTTHFLQWRESVVEWRAVDASNTNVTWTLDYERGLDPAWYFAPMERYAVRLSAGYLIDAVATP